MAKNIVFEDGDQLYVLVTAPASGGKSGDPCLVGALAGVLLTDQDDAGFGTVKFNGVADLSVKGIDGSGNSAVAVGDRIYYSSGDTPKLNKKTSGTVLHGTAIEVVGSGLTDTIRVRIGY